MASFCPHSLKFLCRTRKLSLSNRQLVWINGTLFILTRPNDKYDKCINCIFLFFARFRSVYDPLQYLLTRESDIKTMRFISTDRHLLEYGRELQKVYDLSKMAASMDLFIPMELFVLDCTKIKEVKHDRYLLFFAKIHGNIRAPDCR